jgi:hypothetical protein
VNFYEDFNRSPSLSSVTVNEMYKQMKFIKRLKNLKNGLEERNRRTMAELKPYDEFTKTPCVETIKEISKWF